MTEDYFRRLFPQNLPVIFQKTKVESLLDLSDNCNSICIDNFNSTDLNEKEISCLKKCYNKSIELDAYIEYEHERIYINVCKPMTL